MKKCFSCHQACSKQAAPTPPLAQPALDGAGNGVQTVCVNRTGNILQKIKTGISMVVNIQSCYCKNRPHELCLDPLPRQVHVRPCHMCALVTSPAPYCMLSLVNLIGRFKRLFRCGSFLFLKLVAVLPQGIKSALRDVSKRHCAPLALFLGVDLNHTQVQDHARVMGCCVYIDTCRPVSCSTSCFRWTMDACPCNVLDVDDTIALISASPPVFDFIL